MPIRLVAPYWFGIERGRIASEADLQKAAYEQRKHARYVRLSRDRFNWRERYMRDPLADAVPAVGGAA